MTRSVGKSTIISSLDEVILGKASMTVFCDRPADKRSRISRLDEVRTENVTTVTICVKICRNDLRRVRNVTVPPSPVAVRKFSTYQISEDQFKSTTRVST